MKINKMVKLAFEDAEKKGFYDDLDLNYQHNALGNKLMSIVTEIGEAQQALRSGDKEHFKEELADAVIRIASLCGCLGIDLESEIKKKMEKNKNRPFLHGKEF